MREAVGPSTIDWYSVQKCENVMSNDARPIRRRECSILRAGFTVARKRKGCIYVKSGGKRKDRFRGIRGVSELSFMLRLPGFTSLIRPVAYCALYRVTEREGPAIVFTVGRQVGQPYAEARLSIAHARIARHLRPAPRPPAAPCWRLVSVSAVLSASDPTWRLLPAHG